jgi:hypothetical protein
MKGWYKIQNGSLLCLEAGGFMMRARNRAHRHTPTLKTSGALHKIYKKALAPWLDGWRVGLPNLSALPWSYRRHHLHGKEFAHTAHKTVRRVEDVPVPARLPPHVHAIKSIQATIAGTILFVESIIVKTDAHGAVS